MAQRELAASAGTISLLGRGRLGAVRGQRQFTLAIFLNENGHNRFTVMPHFAIFPELTQSQFATARASACTLDVHGENRPRSIAAIWSSVHQSKPNIADRLNADQRKSVGCPLLAVGALSTIPIAANVLGKKQPERRAPEFEEVHA